MDATAKVNLVAIVGPTASGKSSLAIEVAKRFNGEIIAADSRTIYTGMDVGTAKPSTGDRKEVPHWGLDLVAPGETYSAHRFKQYANVKIDEIQARSKLPVLVGGSGLYVDAVLYNFAFGMRADLKLRQGLEELTLEQLQDLIRKKKLQIPENYKNKRHLIRTIERRGEQGSRKTLRPDSLIVGLSLPEQELKNRIETRARKMMQSGVIVETANLIRIYGEDAVLRTGGIVYKICIRVLKKEITEQTATTLFTKADWQYARRQRTWFKRNNDIEWFNEPEKAFLHLKNVMST